LPDGGRGPVRMGHPQERLHGRERPGPGADDQQIARTDVRRGHVADHVRVKAKMHQAHAERAHHQPLPADPIARDPAGFQHLVAQAVHLRRGASLEDRANLVQCSVEKGVRAGRFHATSLRVPARSCLRLASASPPSNTALPATMRSTPMAAIEATFSRVTPPSTPSITLRPLRAISSLTSASLRSVFEANRCPPQTGFTARTSTRDKKSSSRSTGATIVPGFSAMPRTTLEPNAW